jgi:hypothetical protein
LPGVFNRFMLINCRIIRVQNWKEILQNTVSITPLAQYYCVFFIMSLDLHSRSEIKSKIDVIILGDVVSHYQQRAGQIHIKLMGISAERLNCNSDPVRYQRAD